jgi:hypothetical protein
VVLNGATTIAGFGNKSVLSGGTYSAQPWIHTYGAGLGTDAGFTCTTLTASADINQTGGQYHYLRGDASTDGSVRVSSPSAGVLIIEARIATVWTEIGRFG